MAKNSEQVQILTMLKDELDRWQELLANLSEEQITAPQLPSQWSIKDVIAHLMAWQQISVARLEAALLYKEPVFPNWLADSDPESEEYLDVYNARIFDRYQPQPWSQVHQLWLDGYHRLLKLGEQIPENDLLDPGKYPWLKGYPLIAVLQGTYEHHHEDHLEPLIAWLSQPGNRKIAG